MVENKTVIKATRWNMVGEIIAKIVSPITTIILARLLSKEVFGIVASITAITSLADLLTDAGFNAYIVQHQFECEEHKKKTFSVCFWSNLIISLTLFLVIVFCRDIFAKLVGCEGYGFALTIAALVLPLTSVSSVAMAIMQKNFDFKKLGLIKIICKLIPLISSIPLALLGLGHWSLIIGTLVGEVASVILCILLCGFIPKLFYSFRILREIFSFSIWAYLESMLEWFLKNGAILFLGVIYGQYLLGVFKTGTTLILQIITAIYSLYGNVYKSALSRENQNDENFHKIFYTFQKYTSILSIPLGLGIFLYRDLATNLLLGESWGEASMIIGLWGLTGTLSIAFGNFFSDGIRAKGYPSILVLINFIYLIAMVILLCMAPNISFETFSIIYCLIKIIQPLLQIIFGKFICKVSVIKVIINCIPQIIGTAIMSIFIIMFKFSSLNGFIGIMTVGLSILIYFIAYFIFVPRKKELLLDLKKMIR